jgi:hypothetical protein
MTKKQPKLMYVEWVDAVADVGWDYEVEATKISLIQSVGWLVKENKDEIVLAADYSEGDTNRRMAIPKSWIRNKKVL